MVFGVILPVSILIIFPNESILQRSPSAVAVYSAKSRVSPPVSRKDLALFCCPVAISNSRDKLSSIV